MPSVTTLWAGRRQILTASHENNILFWKEKNCSPENKLILMPFPIELKNSAIVPYEVIQVIKLHSQKWERSRSLYSRAITTEPLYVPPDELCCYLSCNSNTSNLLPLWKITLVESWDCLYIVPVSIVDKVTDGSNQTYVSFLLGVKRHTFLLCSLLCLVHSDFCFVQRYDFSS